MSVSVTGDIMEHEEIKTEEVKHKRRVRYKGTHPRRFEEKYKELNPEKYADDVAHIIARGATPAGMHRKLPLMHSFQH